MSDIVGIIDGKNYIKPDKIDSMTDVISNNKSINVEAFNPVDGCYFGLTFADKPIYNEDKTLVLYFNGQIYNYKELEEKLKNKGHIFESECKSEVVIHLFEEYGKECLKYLDGMFSFCILNILTKSIFVARDKYGIKPMYYYYSESTLILASNLKAIINVKKENKINKKAVELYANLRFIPAPYTIIENISKLRAGEYLTFENGIIEKNRYIKYNQVYENFNISDMTRVIREDILSTCDYDDKMRIFLSGGLDSAIVASVLNGNGKKVKTFSVGYEENTENDETEKAKKIATELDVSNICYKLKNSELVPLLNETMCYLNEPLYSTVSIPTLKLSKLASQQAQIVLTGDGSDEIFFGYKYLMESLNNYAIEKSYLNGIGWLKETKYNDLFMETNFKEEDIRNILFEECHMNNFAETFRRVELFKRLPEYHFARVERLTNMCGLEVRVPFLRKNIVENVLGVDYKELINYIEPKKALKEWMKMYLTNSIKEARKKPFTSPTKQWIENVFFDDIKRLFKNKELIEICGLNIITINNLLDKYTGEYSDVSEIWGIYMLLKWLEQNRENIC